MFIYNYYINDFNYAFKVIPIGPGKGDIGDIPLIINKILGI